MKRILGIIILTLVSVLISLILIESALTVGKYKKISLNWKWEVSPAAGGYVFDSNRIYSINKTKYNDGGFRYNPDQVLVNTVDPGLDKVVVLGDSVTFGVGVSDVQTFPYLLEKLLNTNNKKDVVVDNAGVSGYGIDQEYLYLRDRILPEVKPEMVVWAINVNDVIDSNSACLFKKEDNKFKQISAKWNFLYWQGVADRTIPEWVLESRTYNLLIAGMSRFFVGSVNENRFTFGCSLKNMKDKRMVEERVYSKVQFLLSEAKKLSDKYHAKILIALVPYQSYFDKQTQSEKLDPAYYKLMRVISDEKLSFVDLNSEIMMREGEKEFAAYRRGYMESAVNNGKDWSKILFMGVEDATPLGWRHPNASGYQMMANVIYDKIRELK